MKFDPIYEPKEVWGNPRSSRVRMWLKLLVVFVIVVIITMLAAMALPNFNFG